jgi:hypothetical protein
VSQTISPQHHHFTLNTDGRRHPMANTLSILAICLALVAAVSAWYPSTHLVGSWAGAFGLIASLWAQMISATTAERWINISAMVISGVAFGFGLAHGGLY